MKRRAAALFPLLSLIVLPGCDGVPGLRKVGEAPPARASASAPTPSGELPTLGKLGEFRLVDQDGEAFGSADLLGNVWVANFFFTRCPTICPKVTRRMREVQKAGATRTANFRLVSFSVDPDTDTPEVLRKYAKDYEADPKNWTFLTGDFAVIKKTTVDGFKVALEGKADPSADHYGILHGSHFVLVDRDLRIRGYYRSSDEQKLKQLVDDVLRLGS